MVNVAHLPGEVLLLVRAQSPTFNGDEPVSQHAYVTIAPLKTVWLLASCVSSSVKSPASPKAGDDGATRVGASPKPIPYGEILSGARSRAAASRGRRAAAPESDLRRVPARLQERARRLRGAAGAAPRSGGGDLGARRRQP